LRGGTSLVALLVVFGITLPSLSSCRSSSPDTESEISDEALDSEDDYDEDFNGPNQRRNIKDKYPHPRSANTWETKVLILTSNLPPVKSLNDCQAEITALSEDAGNGIRIMKVSNSLNGIVGTNPLLYHWCFYWMSRNLDLKLDYLGKSIDRKIDIFYRDMASLWALSRSLDRTRKVDFYFKYLRRRYIEVSKRVFGRPLEVVTDPIGSPDGPPAQVSFGGDPRSLGKPAGAAIID